ncbi:NADH dehydrogenase (ubiquinone) SGDH subunit [Haematobia irritans]|uniref:NADH dehydrogenase [ubiquinone] 1 beta subcomplex subunit 5, mitochondrial n=1 Tax=Haematobia irritans TaxID=7368 RepID=A0A1L8EET7_HAEIR
MVSWSCIVRPAAQLAKYRTVLQTPAVQNAVQMQLRQMGGGHHHMIVQPSRFQWNKFKDLLHFYVMLGVLPITALVMYSNIFIGPAQLQEIPEGYEPKHWEYHKHPISRFIARYILTSPQQEYEKSMHHLFEEDEKAKIRKLEEQIRAKMSERNDYKAYYYRPAIAKYHRISKESADALEEIRGDN